MHPSLWTEVAATCTSGVSVSESEEARMKVPVDMKTSDSCHFFLFPTCPEAGEDGNHFLFLLLPLVVCAYPEIWERHSLVWAILVISPSPETPGRGGAEAVRLVSSPCQCGRTSEPSLTTPLYPQASSSWAMCCTGCSRLLSTWPRSWPTLTLATPTTPRLLTLTMVRTSLRVAFTQRGKGC